MTAQVDLYVIARLDVGDVAVDVYFCEVFVHSANGSFGGRTSASWSRTLQPAQDVSADLDGLDRTMSAAGYRRTTGWRERVTASGAMRYFADATTRLGATVTGPVAAGGHIQALEINL
ncbi:MULTISPECIES: hypothetical protein [Nocardia]|uniref:hypothetical protein n=1 Tax=Nocardia TaxID=1817 RepID=UPI00292CAF10|nr:hypothetical protein [Nocardia canadensis]